MGLDNNTAPAQAQNSRQDCWVRCRNMRCDGIMVQEAISCARPDKPSVLLAWGERCNKCRRIFSVKLAPGCPEQVTLGMVERVYRPTGISLFTWAELKDGKVTGFIIPDGPATQQALLNPDRFIEPKGGQE